MLHDGDIVVDDTQIVGYPCKWLTANEFIIYAREWRRIGMLLTHTQITEDKMLELEIYRDLWLRVCAFGRWINGLDHCAQELMLADQLRAEVERDRYRVF